MSWLVTNKRSFFHQQSVMFGLMGLLVIAFIVQLSVPLHWELAFMTIPADVAESWSALKAGQVGLNEAWSFATLITYAFMHGSVEHLGNNLLFFWVFGALINELLSWRWLIITVLLTALGGAITHTVMNHENWVPMVGASGVVSGFMGAYLGLSVRWRLPNPHIWPIARPVPPANLALMAVVFVAIDYTAIFGGAASMTAYGAHVGGFTTGLFLACFITPRPALAEGKR